MNSSIVILGIGGNAQEVAWLIDDINSACKQWQLLGFVDTVNSGHKELYGYPVLGNYETVAIRHPKLSFVCGMGSPAIRQKESHRAESLGWRPATLIHPSVIRAKFLHLSEGATVAAGSILGPFAKVGRHCFLNNQVVIGHHATVGDFSVISPGARITGNVEIGDLVSIGSNASVHPKCKIGTGASLAGNSFLQSDLGPGQSAAGVPAKVFYRAAEHQLRQISR